MEATKRKYEKKKTERKVTIKYYLNIKLKPEISESGEELYPLYFQLLFKGKNTGNKSRIHDDATKFSAQTFKKLERLINSDTEIIFSHFSECMKLVRNNFNAETAQLRNEEEVLLFLILREKMLINKIVRDLRPFERNDFNINEFNYKFDIYNYRLKDSISKILRDNISKILLQEIRNCINENANFFFNIIDWTNANPYELYMILKKQYSSIENLMKLFPYSFSLVSEGHLAVIPEYRDFLVDFYNNGRYVDFYLNMNYITDKVITTDKHTDTLINSIEKEIHTLFSSL